MKELKKKIKMQQKNRTQKESEYGSQSIQLYVIKIHPF